jgi:hypothetical protein
MAEAVSSESSTTGATLSYQVSDVVDEDCVLVHARSSTESTLLCLRSDGREGVGDDRNEQINEPKVQNDDADNKKEK